MEEDFWTGCLYVVKVIFAAVKCIFVRSDSAEEKELLHPPKRREGSSPSVRQGEDTVE